MYCKCKYINVVAENLESFILTSEFAQLGSFSLHRECVKLKYISVSAQLSDTCFAMPGTSRHNMKALLTFQISEFLATMVICCMPNDVISLKARNPLSARLNLDWDDEHVVESTFLPPWTHFPAWRDFLQNFDIHQEFMMPLLRLSHIQKFSGRHSHHRY